jgi:hypothetical protein
MKHGPSLKVTVLALLLFGGTAASATPQSASAQSQAQSPSPPAATSAGVPSAGDRRVTLQGASGPVTVTSGQSQALPNAADYQATVADLDRNGDGVLTRAEVPPDHALSSEFKLVDRNRDGRITPTELQNWR